LKLIEASIREVGIGTEIQLPHALVFFGNKNAKLESLRLEYPRLSFLTVKQTHGDTVVQRVRENTLVSPEADAHWTSMDGQGLCISTADCISLFVHSETFVAAVHAGWRGIANRIVCKTIWRLLDSGENPANISIFIGPHIRKQSFEVDDDVLKQLINSCNKGEPAASPSAKSGKFLVDLSLILRLQILEFGLTESQFFDLKIDTKTNPLYHSYRRDKEKSGRQVSFIALG
jgi:polyphenol oxidase